MSERPGLACDSGLAGIIALLGFVLVATAQVTNMILARGLAGSPEWQKLAHMRSPEMSAFARLLGCERTPVKPADL